MLSYDKDMVNVKYDIKNPKFKKAMKQVGITRNDLKLMTYSDFSQEHMTKINFMLTEK